MKENDNAIENANKQKLNISYSNKPVLASIGNDNVISTVLEKEHLSFKSTNTIITGKQRQGASVSIDWHGFALWLKNRGLRDEHRSACWHYARKWWHCLFSGELSQIEGISAQKHVMCALANLSKFLGCYGYWKKLKEESGLHWKNTNSLDVFQRIYQNEVGNVEEWVDEILNVGDEELSMVTVFAGLTGLRTCEVFWCLNTIAERGLDDYLKDGELLEHFKVKGEDGKPLFLRGNKNAYVSIVVEKLLPFLERWERHLDYDKLVKRLHKHGMKAQFYNLRKWYATTLVMHGIPESVADLLEGRIGSRIFVAHYMRPDFREVVEKVKVIIEPYAQKWIS